MIICENTASQLFTQLNMPKFEVCQTGKLNLTSTFGLALIGRCWEAAQVDRVVVLRLRVLQGMRGPDLVEAMVGRLGLGRGGFEAVGPFRAVRSFKGALGLSRVFFRVWMRRWFDAEASELRALSGGLSVRLLGRSEAAIVPYGGSVGFESDTFVMDNGDTKKEDVGRTCQGVDG